jgi:voltage-gated potassium channel
MAVSERPEITVRRELLSAAPSRLRRAWLRYLLPAAAFVVVAGAAGMAAFSTDTTESFWDGVWWSISLMTTVGWSGQVPHTLIGHLIATVTMITGFMLLAFTTAVVASLLVREDEGPLEQAELRADREILTEVRALRAELEELRSASRPSDR